MDSSVSQLPRTIVVVGGGFAGRAALRYLRKVKTKYQPVLNLILIDEKPFFEFYPSTLRCLVEEEKLDYITVPQKMPDVQFIHGHARAISRSKITVKPANPSQRDTSDIDVKYDFCIWATGVGYAAPIQTRASIETLPTFSARTADISRHRKRILEAGQ